LLASSWSFLPPLVLRRPLPPNARSLPVVPFQVFVFSSFPPFLPHLQSPRPTPLPSCPSVSFSTSARNFKLFFPPGIFLSFPLLFFHAPDNRPPSSSRTPPSPLGFTRLCLCSPEDLSKSFTLALLPFPIDKSRDLDGFLFSSCANRTISSFTP